MSLVENFENEVQRRVQEELTRIEEQRRLQRLQRRQEREQRFEQRRQLRRQERKQREQERQQRFEQRRQERQQRLQRRQEREQRLRFLRVNQLKKEAALRKRMLLSEKICSLEFLKDVKTLMDGLVIDIKIARKKYRSENCEKEKLGVYIADLHYTIKTLERLLKLVPNVLKVTIH